jgi:hypothetical protein
MSFRSTTMARSWDFFLFLAAILEGKNYRFDAKKSVLFLFLFEPKLRDNHAVKLK